MKRIKHPGNFLLACVMAVVCLICLGVCLFFRMDGELLAVGFITGVWAVTDFYEAFHKEPIEERVGGQGDERDVFLAMKSSRTAMGIFNKVFIFGFGAQPVGFREIRLGLPSAGGGDAVRSRAVPLFAAAVRQPLLRKAGVICHKIDEIN